MADRRPLGRRHLAIATVVLVLAAVLGLSILGTEPRLECGGFSCEAEFPVAGAPGWTLSDYSDAFASNCGPHRAGLVWGIAGGALTGQDESWHLHLGFAGGFAITDGRDVIPPGAWTIRVLVVADDAKTRRDDIDVSWNGDASDARAALDSLTLRVRSV